MKPVIGLCIAEAPIAVADKLIANTPYVRALVDAGATPLLIPATDDGSRAAEYIGLIDGLLLPGGQDITPTLFGEDALPQVTYMMEAQDLMEMELLRLAIQKGIPVFGICRGMQLMNVTLGGGLIQDIYAQQKATVGHKQDSSIRSQATHGAKMLEGSLLESLLGTEPLFVNSYHHQALGAVAEGFTVSATAADGIIEAVENPEKKLLGVQWHPEEMYIRYPRFANLFRWLVEKAAAGKK